MLDYLITDAEILDGSGAEAFRGDVGVQGGTITAVGRLADRPAHNRIAANGRTLTPGFLDIHRHGDGALFRPDYGKAELKQGLTSVINGNCGLSAAPLDPAYRMETIQYLTPILGELLSGAEWDSLAAYFRDAAAAPRRIHTGMLVGGGTLRTNVAGYADGPLSAGQLRQLHTLMERALSDGALGVSLGLGYAPECFYSTDELMQALEPLKDSGVVVTVHMRQEGDGVVQALAEMLQVARRLRTPVEISHLKAIGRRNWRSSVPEMLRMMDAARQEGVDVTCDVYPYPAGSTQLIHVLPPEVQTGGLEALTARLRTPACRRELRRRMETGQDFENITALVGFENVVATSLRKPENRCWEGKTLAEIAAAQGKDPFDALFDLLAAERCTVSMIDFIAAEEDLTAILQDPHAAVISDATYPTTGTLHPRVYGMTAHLLEHYVRQIRTLSLPEAVRRLTRLPADRFGLRKKGRIEVGADADLCLFDPSAIHEAGTYAQPRQYAQGMDYVFVGGVPAIADGEFTGHCGGCLLRRE